MSHGSHADMTACTHGLPLTLFAFIIEKQTNDASVPEEFIVPPPSVDLDEIREVCKEKTTLAKLKRRPMRYRIAFAGRARSEAEALTYYPSRVFRDDERGGWLAIFEAATWPDGDPSAFECRVCGKPLAVYPRATGLDTSEIAR